jgi:hypothetical protein
MIISYTVFELVKWWRWGQWCFFLVRLNVHGCGDGDGDGDGKTGPAGPAQYNITIYRNTTAIRKMKMCSVHAACACACNGTAREDMSVEYVECLNNTKKKKRL